MMRRIPISGGVAIAAAFFLLLAPTLRSEDGDGTEFERMLAGFGTMRTIAGRIPGGIPSGEDDCNDWNASWEGGAATNADLSRPHMAQADADGNVYIADKGAHAIRKVWANGVVTTFAGNGVRGNGGEGIATGTSLREPNGLHTFPDGTTYILEIDDECEPTVAPEPGKIRRVGTDGMMTTVLTDPTLVVGRGLWVSPDETLIYYCAGTEVRRWTPAGGIETFSTGYIQLGNIDMDPDGLLVVTDRSARQIETGHHVYRLGVDGATRTIIAGNGTTGGGGHGLAAIATGLNEVRGVAIRPDGSFFVCTHRGSQVWFIDTQGLIWLTINGTSSDSTHAGDGQTLANTTLPKISEPRAITLAPNGDLLITENDNGYIRRVTNICVAPEIISISYRGAGAVTVTWRSHREGSYTLEESTDLVHWGAVSPPPVTGPGASTSATGGGPGPKGFYRVTEH